MVLKERIRKWENWIIALIPILALGIYAGLCFDYYYDLNDDVLMKDILAGVYTGMPEGHNIQMLWPISALISGFYRIAGSLPWYGLFLCGCHFVCMLLITERAVSLCKKRAGKLLVSVVSILLFLAFFLSHLIFAQYTVTCTLLGATAAFLFYTTDITLDTGAFLRKNILSVVLVVIAYLIRSEMLLLVLPMICVAGVCKWGSEKKIFTKDHAGKYLGVIGLILAGLLLGQAAHMLAYNSEEWRAFTEFFDNRTELYDFQAPPAYEENREFYENIGLSESEKILFDNYNFGIDDEIDEKMIGEIAEYAGQLRVERTAFSENLIEKLKSYCYRLLHGPNAVGSDYPWNYLVILGYFLVFFAAFPIKTDGAGRMRNVLGITWKLVFLFAVRSALWMYILWGERAPERITHSLYLMEFCILAAMLMTEWRRIASGKTIGFLGGTALILFAVFGAMVLPQSVRGVEQMQQVRAFTNAPYRELYGYLTEGENQQNFYLIDVYSSVAYSEKMFENVDNSLDNYDIMGGWACKSPLWRKKLAVFGIDSMEQALREREDVYFVRKVSEDLQWINDYYEGHGTPVKLTLQETIAGEFEIYSVEARQ